MLLSAASAQLGRHRNGAKLTPAPVLTGAQNVMRAMRKKNSASEKETRYAACTPKHRSLVHPIWNE